MASSTKFQIPSSKLQRNPGIETPKTKLQTPKKSQVPSCKPRLALRAWNLELGAFLVFGAWCLGFLLALAQLAGGERKTSNIAATTPDANSSALNPRPKASADTNQTRTDFKVEMVQIAGGRFTMGDKNEVDAPLHEVVVSPFFIDKHLVTQEQYQKVMGTNPYRWKGDKTLVEEVRRSDAARYCNKRSELDELQP